MTISTQISRENREEKRGCCREKRKGKQTGCERQTSDSPSWGPRGILGRPLTLRAALRSRCMARTRSMDDGRRACESHTRHTRADRDTDTDTDTHTALPSAGRETRARRSLVAGAHAASPCTDMVGAKPPPPLALELRRAAARSRSAERDFGGQGLA